MDKKDEYTIFIEKVIDTTTGEEVPTDKFGE
jgi:hypothetical protein